MRCKTQVYLVHLSKNVLEEMPIAIIFDDAFFSIKGEKTNINVVSDALLQKLSKKRLSNNALYRNTM